MMNRGAEALVDWMFARIGTTEESVADALGFSLDTIARWISGSVMPGEDEREAIGRLTNGVVLGAMWDEAVTGIVTDTVPADAPADIAAAPLSFYPALLCEISGPMGTVPPGPLFRTITDPMRPGLFVVAGMGQALVLDETQGWALREALTIGLQDVRADRVPVDQPRVAQIG